ncbi:MAG: ATP-binding protein [Desulfuromonadaceae bacterium]|nr:ATP-binding protein [Desulfuromonadaceae bacterium]
MPKRANTTIGQKITTLVMSTSTVILLLFLISAVLIQTAHFRTTIDDKLLTLAHVIGLNSQEAMSFKKKWETQKILNTLAAEPSIEVASIFDRNNEVIAHYLNSKQSSFAAELKNPGFRQDLLLEAVRTEENVSHRSFSHITVYTPIIHAGEYLGCVFVQTNNNELLHNLLWFIIAAMLILGAALALAYLLATRLQKQITTPLHSLTQRMSEITLGKKYAAQAEIATTWIQEIDILIDNFTTMLLQLRDHEQALQHYSVDLEGQVKERTHALKKANLKLKQTILDLRQARGKALMASEAKSRFLANISHEIRTPMIGVLGMAELLQKHPLLPEQMELVNTIYASGEALLTMLNDLLDISKIEAGQLELNLAPFCAPETVDTAVEVLAHSALTKGLDITVSVDPEMPIELYGDAVRLRQIVLNLLSNAIKFTHHGSITIALKVVRKEGSFCHIRLDVHDTGIGINAEIRDRVFEAFKQADSSTSRQYGGTGLGLAIVKQLCELMRGSVHIAENKPHGTVFSLEIPFETTPATTTLREHWLNCEANLHTLTAALIVSPNPARIEVLSNLFEAYALSPVILDGAEAVKMFLKKNLVHMRGQILVCLDHAIQSDCGYLAQELKANLPADTSLVIVYIAPNTHILQQKKSMRRDVDIFIPKPFKALNLGTQIAVALPQGRNAILPVPQTQKIPPPKPAAPPATTQAPILLDKRRENTRRAGHILLAEDQHTNQKLICLILEQAGYTLSCADNGLGALHLVDSEQFDLILMDCQMPQMDGYAATRELRRRGITVPIVALTAHIYRNDAQCWGEAGMDAYLPKPFKQQQLLDIVAQFMPISKNSADA